MKSLLVRTTISVISFGIPSAAYSIIAVPSRIPMPPGIWLIPLMNIADALTAIIHNNGTFVDIERNNSFVDAAASVICIIVVGKMYRIFLLNISSRHVDFVIFMMFIVNVTIFLMNLLLNLLALLDRKFMNFSGTEM